jgi:hypothetical protein
MGSTDTPRRSGHTPLVASTVAGQATFAGCLAMISVPRDTVGARLPSSVTLPPGASHDYPCLLAFGEQSEGTTFFGGVSVPWGVRYHELMVAIPFVRCEGAGEYLFVSGMTCDFLPAVWNGNFYYGFNKRFAAMSCNGERFAVAGDQSGATFDARLRVRAERADDALEWVRTAAALPVLGHRSGDILVPSRFEWDFQDASVQAASLTLVLTQQFPELRLREPLTTHEYAYLVQRMQWRLSWPGTAAQQ